MDPNEGKCLDEKSRENPRVMEQGAELVFAQLALMFAEQTVNAIKCTLDVLGSDLNEAVLHLFVPPDEAPNP